jgi:hypothetical protein
VRLARIEFNGYKRLLSTSCSIDGKIVSFVGPNETGKSSVLEGLAWLTSNDGEALASHLRSRGGVVRDDARVVRAHFDLDADDLAAVAHVSSETQPARFRMSRGVDGGVQVGVDPPMNRVPLPFDTAKHELVAILHALERVENRQGEADLVRRAIELLGDACKSEHLEELQGILSDLELRFGVIPGEAEEDGVALPGAGEPALLEALALAITACQAEHPSVVARAILRTRVPRFLLFTEEDRVLQSAYSLNDDQLRANPPKALANLLALAETDTNTLWSHISSGDVTALMTHLRRCNERLKEALHPTWKQSRLTVELDTDGALLRVLVVELDPKGSTVVVTERSDGLKTFIALVAFLAVQKRGDVAPVLLIDEAETHLHYDAQADLIDMLANRVDASTVLYTTHSPGCLPFDLGTGVRLVAGDPDNRDASVLRYDFWQSSEVGFSSLLFAMGAGAAAFSACRAAVLAEGPTEMVLLPSLIRQATGHGSLPYQVAPGLSYLRRGEIGAEVAGRLAYLVDGDDGGRAIQKQLTDAGVPAGNVHVLPAGLAIEDLLTRECYVEAVNAVMKQRGIDLVVAATELDPALGIVAAIRQKYPERQAELPGKVTVATYLIQDPAARVKLTDDGERDLRAMHATFKSVLKV